MSRTITVSWSEIDTARQCPLKHQLAYVERWQGTPRGDGPLAKGSAWHQIMETHYRSLMATQPDYQDRVRGVNRTMDAEQRIKLAMTAVGPVFDDIRDSLPEETYDLLMWMYAGYLEQWGDDPDWDIRAVEWQSFARLPAPSGAGSRFVLKIRADLVVRTWRQDMRKGTWIPQLWVVDHKSGARLASDKELELNDQFGLYTWLMRRLDRPVFGVVHNGARTHKNKNQDRFPQPLDERFARTLGYRTDVELDTIAHEAYATLDARYKQQREVDKARGAVYEVPNPIGGVALRVPVKMAESPRHTNEDTCKWRCDFMEPCLGGRKGMDLRQFIQDRGMRQNPERH